MRIAEPTPPSGTRNEYPWPGIITIQASEPVSMGRNLVNLRGLFTAFPVSQDPRIQRLRNITANWNGMGSEAPSPDAVQKASDILDECRRLEMQAARVNASAEGGVGLLFSGQARYGFVEILNDGATRVGVIPKNPREASWLVRVKDPSHVKAKLTDLRARLRSHKAAPRS